MSVFEEIRGSESWLSVEKIEKGWASDEKYHARTQDGRYLQLRISAPERYAAKKKECEIIEKFSSLGFPISEPVGFGRCAAGTYMLLTWVEGDDLEKVLPLLPEKEQYRLGCEAGGILRRIHSLPLDAADVPEKTKKGKKLRQLERYEVSDVRIPDDESTIAFVRENIDSIWTQPRMMRAARAFISETSFSPNGPAQTIEKSDAWALYTASAFQKLSGTFPAK